MLKEQGIAAKSGIEDADVKQPLQDDENQSHRQHGHRE